MGTTAGMLVADGIGIIVGVVMCKRIPERTIKLFLLCLYSLGYWGVIKLEGLKLFLQMK